MSFMERGCNKIQFYILFKLGDKKAYNWKKIKSLKPMKLQKVTEFIEHISFKNENLESFNLVLVTDWLIMKT